MLGLQPVEPVVAELRRQLVACELAVTGQGRRADLRRSDRVEVVVEPPDTVMCRPVAPAIPASRFCSSSRTLPTTSYGGHRTRVGGRAGRCP
jgi:hypothetical protein